MAGRKSCHCRRRAHIGFQWIFLGSPLVIKIQIRGPADGPIKWYIIETLAVVFPELAAAHELDTSKYRH